MEPIDQQQAFTVEGREVAVTECRIFSLRIRVFIITFPSCGIEWTSTMIVV